MRIHIRVQVGEGYYGSSPHGESEVEVRTEADIAPLPWEAICANLVQNAIKEYEKAVAKADSEGE